MLEENNLRKIIIIQKNVKTNKYLFQVLTYQRVLEVITAIPASNEQIIVYLTNQSYLERRHIQIIPGN